MLKNKNKLLRAPEIQNLIPNLEGSIQNYQSIKQDIEETQNIFNHRANMCSLAAQGKWANELENK